MTDTATPYKYIKFFEEIGIEDIPTCGGKNASLGEMVQQLSGKDNLLVPTGFAITSNAYRALITENNLEKPLRDLCSQLDKTNLDEFQRIGLSIRSLIGGAPIPKDIVEEIKRAYVELEKKYYPFCDVAVRSSATAEDLPNASFAGQQETFLNVRGAGAILIACSKAYASLFTNRAISYRIDQGFDHLDVALSIGVQKMIRSDKASSGVMFTIDTESGSPDVVFISSAFGLGETVVQGSVVPDQAYVSKPLLKKGFKPLLKKRLGSKKIKMIYTQSSHHPTKIVPVPHAEREKFSLTNEEILSLAKNGIAIEEHYSKKRGSYTPFDIEFAKDGIDGKLYILQARPETVHSMKSKTSNIFEEYHLTTSPVGIPIVAKGLSIGSKIASGPARVFTSTSKLSSVKPGEILVTDMTDPDFEPIMKIAAGIITNRGGRTCHAAIISRELGIPSIVGSHNATKCIKDGDIVTIDCSSGEVGLVYAGKLDFEISKTDLGALPKPPVDIMVNVGNPDKALTVSLLPSAGVGLARLEFIINTSIQLHPMALVHPEKVTDPDILDHINRITVEYPDKKQFFVDKLAEEAGTIAAAFYPRPVIIRMSDFKSNEYRQLIGGTYFEPVEENPMIGFRGASRYHHPMYKEAFLLECYAMKKMRDEMGLTNVKLMIPFVRTLKEAKLVIEIMKSCGLVQGTNGLEIFMMCEVPANVILIDEFCQIFDGFSIGSNDLTQLTLAVDRDSDLVSPIFDERNLAVTRMLTMAIKGAKRNNKKIGICGQAPSDYPEIAQLLVDLGIDSMSLNPDAVLKEIIHLGGKSGLTSTSSSS